MLKIIDSFAIFTLLASILISCNPKPEQQSQVDSTMVTSKPQIPTSSFGKMPDGREVKMFTLSNDRGMSMSVINYGGIIVALNVPDKNGKIEDVVLGYDSLTHYIKNNPYFGALIGRYGNRIAKGKFSLDGNSYQLDTNNEPNHLHGGSDGYHAVFWNIEPDTVGRNALRLTYQSKDGEEGYPGNLNIEVVYLLTEKNELNITYKATTDKKTIINLTQHSYFNLSGDVKKDILDHELHLNADRFVPVDETLIPTGTLKNVEGTPFDFRTPMTIGSRIDKKDQQLQFGRGYDHCWVLNDQEASNKTNLTLAATLYEATSGRVMSVYTTEPGIQFYSGNFLDGSNIGKKGAVYKHRYGLCLESEHFPDSPNQKNFPSVELNPGETYFTQTVYSFSTK
jgi:aldose 1-epimerase